MKGFEEAFSLLHGFEFEAPQDRENALWFMHFIETAACAAGPCRFPLVVITGPKASGKSTLVRRVLEGLEPGDVLNAAITDQPMLEFAASAGKTAIVCQDKARFSKREKLLGRFLTAPMFRGRILGARAKPERLALHCVTIVTGHDLSLPKNLQRRAMFIRLKARK